MSQSTLPFQKGEVGCGQGKTRPKQEPNPTQHITQLLPSSISDTGGTVWFPTALARAGPSVWYLKHTTLEPLLPCACCFPQKVPYTPGISHILVPSQQLGLHLQRFSLSL